jgi:hypothetical protein
MWESQAKTINFRLSKYSFIDALKEMRKEAIKHSTKYFYPFPSYPQRDEVVLSKTVLSNFRPKQVDEWIGGPRASLFQLFIAFLTWPNLTSLNRPLSQFLHHLTPPGWPLIWRFISEFRKMNMERRGGQIIELFLAFLTCPNLTCWRIPLIPSFIT